MSNARLLAICTGGGIGDLLAATPAMQAIARHFAAKMTALASPYAAPILEGHPAIGDVMTDDGRSPLPHLVRALAFREFTHAIVFWSHARVAAAIARAKIPVRIGQSRRLYSLRYTIRVPVRTERGDTASHWTDVQMDYARALGAQPQADDYRIIINLRRDDFSQADALLTELNLRDRFVVLHAARGIPLQRARWPVERFARVGDALGEAFEAPVVLTGSAGDAPVIGQIGAGMCRQNAIIAGRTGMRDLAALLTRAAVVVALDSGPMHIAAAVGAPTVGVFALRTDLPKRWRPLGPRVAVIEPSYPCPRRHRKETCRTFDCYASLVPQAIVAAARSVAQVPVAQGSVAPNVAADRRSASK